MPVLKRNRADSINEHANKQRPQHFPNARTEPHAMGPMAPELLEPRSGPLGEPEGSPERDQEAESASRSWVAAPPDTHLDEGRPDVGDTWSNYDQNDGAKPGPGGTQVVAHF